MAAVIGDFVSDISRFHNVVNGPSSLQNQLPHQHQQPAQASPHSRPSPDRPRPAPTSSTSATAAPLSSRQHQLPRQQQPQSPAEKPSSAASSAAATHLHFSPGSEAAYTAAKFPSPPPSSSPAAVPPPPADDAKGASMATQTRDFVSPSHSTDSAPTVHGVNPAQVTAPARAAAPASTPRKQQPSPPSDDLARSSNPSQAGRRGWRNPAGQTPPQNVIHVRDLAHVQTLVQERALGGSAAGAAGQTKYEISAMPIGDVIEMVAALLTKITGTNDLQHDAMQRNVTHQQQANQTHESSSHMSPLSHSVLAFHGKNVPAITILSYLARIHKYCPTTYEVFLSLLVYFDRMTERVNDLVVKSEHARRRAASLTNPARQPPSQSHSRSGSRQQDMGMPDSAPAAENSDESDSDLADDDDDDDDDDTMVDSPTAAARNDGDNRIITVPDENPSVHGPATYFVVDSFNIHRLIIAGVTCASKFFSDVFYTNSRYAKVGGLPLAELNHLELQFLVLNDFRLAIPVEDLEGYATMLVEFYAREVVAKNTAS